jgi:hypothetical protein
MANFACIRTSRLAIRANWPPGFHERFFASFISSLSIDTTLLSALIVLAWMHRVSCVLPDPGPVLGQGRDAANIDKRTGLFLTDGAAWACEGFRPFLRKYQATISAAQTPRSGSAVPMGSKTARISCARFCHGR